jgi:hypothetical protein
MQTVGQMNGQTGRYDEANGSFSQFFERAYILHIYEVHEDISGYLKRTIVLILITTRNRQT